MWAIGWESIIILTFSVMTVKCLYQHKSLKLSLLLPCRRESFEFEMEQTVTCLLCDAQSQTTTCYWFFHTSQGTYHLAILSQEVWNLKYFYWVLYSTCGHQKDKQVCKHQGGKSSLGLPYTLEPVQACFLSVFFSPILSVVPMSNSQLISALLLNVSEI